MNTRFVSVYETGSLIIGTAACPVTAKVIFTFYGPRAPSDCSDMGIDAFDQRMSLFSLQHSNNISNPLLQKILDAKASPFALMGMLLLYNLNTT